MSNSIGHNLIHHNLLALVVLEHQSKINSSCISGYNLFQVQANSQIRKSYITSKFWGKCLNLRKTKLPIGTNRVLSVFPQSMLAIDPLIQLLRAMTDITNDDLSYWFGCQLILSISFIVATYRKFNLDGNTKLQVVVSASTCVSDRNRYADENDDIQDDDVSLGADFVQRDEHSEFVSEISSRIVMIMDDMVDEGEVEFVREHFASNPDQVIVTKISGSTLGSLFFMISDVGTINVLDDNKLKIEGSDWAVMLLVALFSFDGPFTRPSDSKKDPTLESLSTFNLIKNLSYADL
ncbi:hypothetical protein LOK49_LG13G00069 [Camellia lanceoleosa]|uniref:Uncharacterized protein n=1 Tax=Camellia lanceoleosa TaxID=1840588 RepID=A0ACC0FKU4_9ERIC|nr:hypothetical protein LOK49_LG13G00069 [Camellia lanceoleosa]